MRMSQVKIAVRHTLGDRHRFRGFVFEGPRLVAQCRHRHHTKTAAKKCAAKIKRRILMDLE
jgi:hypothetical protein